MKLKKIRNALLVVLTLALVSATTVAITWAAGTHAPMTAKTNNFTNNPEISLQFQELTFDALPYGTDRTAGDANVKTGTDAVTGVSLPDGTAITQGKDLGYNLARSYVANQYIPKNPQLKNNTNTTLSGEGKETNGVTSDEWVALGVKYTLTIPEDAYEVSSTPAGDNSKQNPIVVNKVGKNSTENGIGGSTVTFANYTNFSTAIATVRYVPATKADGTERANDDKTLDDTDTVTGVRLYTNGVDAGSGYGTVTDNDENTHQTWTDISATSGAGTLFMYNKKLTKNEETTTLFDCVRINNIDKKWVKIGDDVVNYYELTITGSASNTYVPAGGSASPVALSSKKVYVSAPPEFEIDLTGYAIQADNVAYADAPAAIRGFVASKG